MSKIDFKNYDQILTENFTLPHVGIEDIDRALFELFDKDISFDVVTNGTLEKVPVVFAAGERFALTRRKSPIRDDNNTLILPIISILREGIDFSPGQAGRGTAIAPRDQENYVIKRRLASEDRNYQNLKNKMGLMNQDNVAARKNFLETSISPGNIAAPGALASRRQGNSIKFSKSGGTISLDSRAALGDNIFEIIQVPYPTFVAITYKVTFWTQYMKQMNQIQETYLSRFPGQAEEFLLKTKTGYEFVAASSTSFTTETNLDNYTEEERIIKSSVSLIVPGYILNPQHPGVPNQVRSFLSAPTIEFGYHTAVSPIVKEKRSEDVDRLDKFMLTDIETLDDINNRPKRGQDSASIQTEIINPFTEEKSVAFSKVLSRNERSGETVASSVIVKKIETQYE